MVTPLTEGVQQRIALLFAPSDAELVSSVLSDECGRLTKYPVLLERIHIAILKLSNGDLDAFRGAVKLAKRDWRDALVAAGFGNSLTAHESWWPEARP